MTGSLKTPSRTGQVTNHSVIGAVAITVILTLSAIVVATLWLQPFSSVPGGNGSTALVPLPGTNGQLPSSAVPTGAVAASTQVSFDVAIALPQTSALQTYLAGLSNPSSPYYLHYLPFQDFYSQYGPDSSQVQSLTDYFSAYGLSITSTGGPLIYGVSGTASQVNQALHISLTNYTAGNLSGMAPSATPELPSTIASLVESFQGLNTFDNPHTLLAFPTASPRPLAETTPSVMRGFYDETGLISAGKTGAQAIGLAEECSSGETTSGYTSDLAAFDNAYGLPSATISYMGSGANSCRSSNGDWYEETDLDIQWAHAMAPGAPIVVCLDSSDPSVCDQTFVTDGIPFGSNSWGGETSDHSVWQSAMAAGITLLASAGDSGAATDYPASEPDGIGVGGTSITPSGSSYGSETAWSDSGGGCDSSDAPPSYQIGMAGYPGACSTTSDRGVPDVSMDADPNTGVPVYINGASEQFGGTSLSCPMWAAALDVIYQASGFSGFAGPTIYQLAKGPLYSSVFHDVTTGSNGYSATAGWDPVTGVGTPNIGALAANFNGGSAALLATASASPTSGLAPLTVTFSGSASGGASPYTWSWTFGDGATSTSQNPSHTYSAAGTYIATLTVADSKTATSSDSVTITVTSVPALSATASASPTSGLAPLAVSFTGSASGGTSPYTWNWAFGDGGTSTSQNPSHTYSSVGTYTATLTVTDSSSATSSSSVTITVTSVPALSATASASPTSGYTPLAVSFTGSASGGTSPYTWSWAFGDGSSSSSQNPSHTYSSAGTYTATLTVTDSASATSSSSVTITVNAVPSLSASASASTTSGTAPLAVSFTGSASGGVAPYSWSWAFGDGSTSASQNPSHTYSSAGTYTATLTVTDSRSTTASSSVTITVTSVPALTATASASPTSGYAPLAVSLTGSASGGTTPYKWSWAFGDGSSSTSQNPSHTYSFAGTYTATLSVTDSKSTTSSSSVIISVSTAPALSATASASPTSGTAPLAVSFTGSATGGTSPYAWSWAFGDGGTSTSQNPSHTYSSAGTYTATLTVTDSKSATSSSSVTITAGSASSGCGTPTALTNDVQVAGTLSAGGCVLYSIAVTEDQWDNYYYLNAYETDGNVSGSQPVFAVYAGMSPPTVTTTNAAQSASGPNASVGVSLMNDSSDTFGGWGTYEFVVQASDSGSGTFCFLVELDNNAPGNTPACTALAPAAHASPSTAQSLSPLSTTSAYLLPIPIVGGLVSVRRNQD